VLERALAGDMTALKLRSDRLAPPSKDPAISMKLSPVRTAADAPWVSAVVREAASYTFWGYDWGYGRNESAIK
jgi:hypothetical protein